MLCQMFKAVATAAIVVGLSACTSAGGSPPPASSGPDVSSMPDAGMSMDREMDVGALGEPADAANADHTTHLIASDQLAFAPRRWT